MIGIFTNSDNMELISWVKQAAERLGLPDNEIKVIHPYKKIIRAREHVHDIKNLDACIIDLDQRLPSYYYAEVGSLEAGVINYASRIISDEKGYISDLDSRLLFVTKRHTDEHEFLRDFGEWFTSVSLTNGVNEKLTDDLVSWLRDTLTRSVPRIFISYRSSQRDFARSIANSLKRRGASPWFDEWNILPGDSIPESINRGLRWCTHLTLIVDKTFFHSRWAKAEVEAVLYRHLSGGQFFRTEHEYRALIPLFLVDPLSNKMPPLLARIRGIDCRGKTLRQITTQLWNAITVVGPR